MGDIADELAEQCFDERVRYEKQVIYWLTQSDEELKANTSASRLPIIVSIRKINKLSPKQRTVLANWLAQKEYGYLT